ncbi:MAG: T9SS type A sorting domain-containing protein [Candidatus Krumholzibacteriia bacterium]
MPRNHPSTPARPVRGSLLRRLLKSLVLCLGLGWAASATALLSIDFEQPFYVHDGWQVWDFCLIRHEGLYHIFYLAVPESNPHPSESDVIWHATSPDLVHWGAPEYAVTVSHEVYETKAVWAPDVVWDADSGRWAMAYTAVDDLNNQRICLAWSDDLDVWTKSTVNPVLQPSGDAFLYFPDAGWAECRDPFLYREGGLWHILASALTPGLPQGQGSLLHATSNDLEAWSAPDVFLLNTGETPANALESSQYHQINGGHHLFFHEYSSQGVTHLGATEPGGWSFDERTMIDLGIAPEVDSFDDGQTWLLSRAAPYQEPVNPVVSVATRIDTLQFRQGAVAPTVFRADPWARDFVAYGGSMCLGNPCFGDNPAARGDPPAGTVGNSYFGSREYFRGPLSNRGAAGIELGNSATGFLRSHDFVIEGTAIRFLIGGSNQPDLCYIALCDADVDTVLRRTTGNGAETMVQRWWDVTDLQGRSVYLRIEDAAYDGYINLDEIQETYDVITAVPEPAPPATGLRDLGAWPNPFNPRTTLRYSLARAATVDAAVYDLRGRRVWRSGPLQGQVGANGVSWSGESDRGGRLAGGVYVYRITGGAGEAVSGKVTLIP